MSIAVTNRIAAPALRGQAVKVSLTGTDITTDLPNITVGMIASMSSTSNTGKVISVDTYGSSFEVIPTSPAGRFESSTPGYLAVSESITLS